MEKVKIIFVERVVLISWLYFRRGLYIEECLDRIVFYEGIFFKDYIWLSREEEVNLGRIERGEGERIKIVLRNFLRINLIEEGFLDIYKIFKESF